MAGYGGGELRAPIFNGENYEFWSIRMKTIFKSHGLWEFVEKRVECSYSKGANAKKKEKEESSDAGKMTLTEVLMKDAKALGLIQEAVSDVRSVKLQGLRREFECTRMRDDESLSVYLTRLFDIINQMRSYGEELSRQRVVQKVLISLPLAYYSIHFVIEHSKDLDVIEVQEVIASLKSFELRLDRHSENKIERAFASLSVNPKSDKPTGNQSTKDQKNWKAKGNEWDNKSIDGPRNTYKHCGKMHFGECRFKGKPKCYNCDKFGHLARDCYSKKPEKSEKPVQQLNGCSNHMTGKEDLLVDIDKNWTAKVKMGTGQPFEVTGKGNMVVETKIGKRYIKEVMLVPGLKENLLRVGKMMEHGFYLVFEYHKVEIYDDNSYSNIVAKWSGDYAGAGPLEGLTQQLYVFSLRLWDAVYQVEMKNHQ
ncbi:hypothetical protein L3X38_034166 [Prunus dulcis]|uniref:CCHC-type domain-containing protein n=1 Tax=Prunus dulcis TaxID=3755 RepID=A0AAD4VIZ3_PRUDU|nr:hypothetical protein L3X38_034166 [Prunus dulcis]